MSEIQSIAQNNYILHNIDAKKLYVQEPLFTANSGDAVYVGWRPDETVLWSGNTNSGTLSEPISAFEYVKFYCRDDAHRSFIIDVAGTHSAAGQTQMLATTTGNCSLRTLQAEISGTNFAIWGSQFGFNGSTTAISWMNGRSSNSTWTIAEKVVGINRKENA